ncbi:LOW QUALITY PROTEIN: hypothetical protein CVT26_015452 [Gymnopilus dilepis]|uniref:Uncharacterized protein n=1 Tax=Gymnopilus dilepis TaxID=231916 RepID=A0A409W499_9AGAR|nr:LOW QUALITY PROTEIN: hypothetical protein CVT26_015452 [Gymnopilus dilepis]
MHTSVLIKRPCSSCIVALSYCFNQQTEHSLAACRGTAQSQADMSHSSQEMHGRVVIVYLKSTTVTCAMHGKKKLTSFHLRESSIYYICSELFTITYNIKQACSRGLLSEDLNDLAGLLLAFLVTEHLNAIAASNVSSNLPTSVPQDLNPPPFASRSSASMSPGPLNLVLELSTVLIQRSRCPPPNCTNSLHVPRPPPDRPCPPLRQHPGVIGFSRPLLRRRIGPRYRGARHALLGHNYNLACLPTLDTRHKG